MSRIGELFGVRVDEPHLQPHDNWNTCHCPFTKSKCDVSANRGDRAYLDLKHAGVSPEDREAMIERHGDEVKPFGICSLSTQRHHEKIHRPWIVCPKRLLDLKQEYPGVPPELRALIDIKPGTLVRCWNEVKFRYRDPESQSFFEYTFDYLIMPIEQTPTGTVIAGPPFIVEIMTSSTRGGGLTEHMVDVLMQREQRKLSTIVKSAYTPNYRQVFARMLAQIVAKSEIAEAWGGQTIWMLQDVLVEYIEQTTDFEPAEFEGGQEGNVAMIQYTMQDRVDHYQLEYKNTLRGWSRPRDATEAYFTGMLGLGYAPPVEALHASLGIGKTKSLNWRDFVW